MLNMSVVELPVKVEYCGQVKMARVDTIHAERLVPGNLLMIPTANDVANEPIGCHWLAMKQ